MFNCINRLKVLVVDDDDFQIEIIAGAIRNLGHNVITTINPQEAISMVKKHYDNLNPVDVAFLDYIMPEMNGIRLSKELRKQDPDLVCIAISSDETRESKTDILSSNCFDSCVSKNSDINNISHYLEMLMTSKQQKMRGNRSKLAERMKFKQNDNT